MALVFKEFARGAKKEANASDLKALSDKIKLEIEKPFFKAQGAGQGGARADGQGAHGGDRGGRAAGCC